MALVVVAGSSWWTTRAGLPGKELAAVAQTGLVCITSGVQAQTGQTGTTTSTSGTSDSGRGIDTALSPITRATSEVTANTTSKSVAILLSPV